MNNSAVSGDSVLITVICPIHTGELCYRSVFSVRTSIISDYAVGPMHGHSRGHADHTDHRVTLRAQPACLAPVRFVWRKQCTDSTAWYGSWGRIRPDSASCIFLGCCGTHSGFLVRVVISMFSMCEVKFYRSVGI